MTVGGAGPATGGFNVILKDTKGKVVASVILTTGHPATVTLTKPVQIKTVEATPRVS